MFPFGHAPTSAGLNLTPQNSPVWGEILNLISKAFKQQYMLLRCFEDAQSCPRYSYCSKWLITGSVLSLKWVSQCIPLLPDSQARPTMRSNSLRNASSPTFFSNMPITCMSATSSTHGATKAGGEGVVVGGGGGRTLTRCISTEHMPGMQHRHAGYEVD